MLKIRRPLGRLIFNMGIAIPDKTVFLIETAPRGPVKHGLSVYLTLKSCEVSFAHSLFHIYSIVLKWCTLHSGDTDVVCVKYQRRVNWKGCYWLTRFCEFWVWDEFRTDIRLHWTASLEPDFFSYTVSRVSNLVWLRFVLVECFSLSLLQSNMKSCAIF